jgi:hypothetical protein|tara:strand:- start:1200 stop:1517 length:318 start_codon:yes stop_codon:yes gene_type:complete
VGGGCSHPPPLFGEIMQRQHAIGYSKNAEVANSRGVRPSHYAPGQSSEARMVPGVSEWIEEIEEPVEKMQWGSICLAITAKGTPCKVTPVSDTDLCWSHTRQEKS